MRKILVSTILGVGIAGTANASIVSSGFLDEKLTEYALSTSLDLKANQSDLTALNDIIGKGWNTENANLDFSSFPFTNEFGFESTGSWVNTTRGIADMLSQYNANIMFPGLAGVTYKLTNGWTSDVGIGVRIENYYDYNPGLEGMFNGWTIYNPSGSETMVFKGLENISSQIRTIEDTYHTGLSRLLVNGENKINVEAYNYTGPIYPLWKLSEGIDKIGTLPEGITVEAMFNGWKDSNGNYFPGIFNLNKAATTLVNTYHPSDNTADILIQGAKTTTIDGVDYTGPIYPLWKLSEGIDKIGTLPDGITVQAMYEGWTDAGYNFPGLYEIASDTFKFKSTFSNVSIGMLLANGLEEYTNGNYTGPIYPLWKLSEGIDKIDSIETKIGTLPAGYDSVGAALTAIKGIAEDAKAAALAAIPDPKQEGSSGKFVLTVDIVGDNATYHWEKIDREGETTTE